MGENSQYDVVGKPPSPTFTCFMNITNTVTHILLGAVVVCAIFFGNQFSHTTSLEQHIYLCVIGYVLLMSQAILSINPHTGWVQSFKYQEKKVIHWLMQIIGSSLAIAGSIIRIVNVSNHFSSTHSILGILAMILTAISLIGGVFSLYSMRLRANPLFIKVGHSCIGSLTMVMAFLTLTFGFNKDIFRIANGNINANLCMSLTILALIGTLLSASISVFRRIFGR